MKNFKGNSGKSIWKTIVLPVIICVAMLAIMIFVVLKFNQMSLQQDQELTLAAVRKAAVQCFADEGRYPATLDYLVENYGVHIDEDSFMVAYDCAAANVFPNISVFRR
ncbi:MAG: hypothetical protein IK071_08055 [Lachnospiraceae bacterium]|nr:hypothetical protein [Lachnospiraceae bacterium]